MKAFTITILIALSGCGLDHEKAAAEAQDFATNVLRFKQPFVTCQGYDSDGDGYVSCTVVDGATNDREAIECYAAVSWNDGCRIATGAGRRRAK